MTNNVDTVFEWKSSGNRQLNKCRLRIYWLTWEKAIIIATDISDHLEAQVADATQKIIDFATNFYDLAPNKIMLIEHYLTAECTESQAFPVSEGDDRINAPLAPLKDTYVQVLLTDNEPTRYQVSERKLAKLIGKPI